MVKNFNQNIFTTFAAPVNITHRWQLRKRQLIIITIVYIYSNTYKQHRNRNVKYYCWVINIDGKCPTPHKLFCDLSPFDDAILCEICVSIAVEVTTFLLLWWWWWWVSLTHFSFLLSPCNEKKKEMTLSVATAICRRGWKKWVILLF